MAKIKVILSEPLKGGSMDFGNKNTVLYETELFEPKTEEEAKKGEIQLFEIDAIVLTQTGGISRIEFLVDPKENKSFSAFASQSPDQCKELNIYCEKSRLWQLKTEKFKNHKFKNKNKNKNLKTWQRKKKKRTLF